MCACNGFTERSKCPGGVAHGRSRPSGCRRCSDGGRREDLFCMHPARKVEQVVLRASDRGAWRGERRAVQASQGVVPSLPQRGLEEAPVAGRCRSARPERKWEEAPWPRVAPQKRVWMRQGPRWPCDGHQQRPFDELGRRVRGYHSDCRAASSLRLIRRCSSARRSRSSKRRS